MPKVKTSKRNIIKMVNDTVYPIVVLKIFESVTRNIQRTLFTHDNNISIHACQQTKPYNEESLILIDGSGNRDKTAGATIKEGEK